MKGGTQLSIYEWQCMLWWQSGNTSEARKDVNCFSSMEVIILLLLIADSLKYVQVGHLGATGTCALGMVG